jgi:uncharacterized membrane protein
MYNILRDTTLGKGSIGMRFESSIDINAPAEKVWALIDKLEEWPQWMLSIKRIERISKEPVTVGSQLSVTAKVSGFTVRLLMTITKFVPERNVVLEGKVLGTKLTRFYTLVPVNGKTKVTVGGEVSGILAWPVRRAGQAVSAEIAQAAKKKIEGSR